MSRNEFRFAKFHSVSFHSNHSRVPNANGAEEANFSIFDFPKLFSSPRNTLSFLIPQCFSDVRIYFLGAILQSQSLIGRTKFPAASLRSKVSSALTRSDTFVGESCLFFARAIHILKTEIFLFHLQSVILSFSLKECTSSLLSTLANFKLTFKKLLRNLNFLAN